MIAAALAFAAAALAVVGAGVLWPARPPAAGAGPAVVGALAGGPRARGARGAPADLEPRIAAAGAPEGSVRAR